MRDVTELVVMAAALKFLELPPWLSGTCLFILCVNIVMDMVFSASQINPRVKQMVTRQLEAEHEEKKARAEFDKELEAGKDDKEKD